MSMGIIFVMIVSGKRKNRLEIIKIYARNEKIKYLLIETYNEFSPDFYIT